MESWYGRWGKRAFDVIAALFLIVVVAPVMLIVAVGTWMTVGYPVLFRQERAGWFGARFYALKFRSMREGIDGHGNPFPDEVRLTRFGRMIRLTSLDELPSLINVLRGEMSIVGPRPLLLAYNARYTERQLRRLAVRPGITGLAQMRGRQSLRFSQRIDLDLEYVNSMSLLSDLGIMLATIPAVFSARGVINGQLPTEVDDLGPATDPDLSSTRLEQLRKRYA